MDKKIGYEAWLATSAGSLKVRIITVEATDERSAFAAAKAECVGTEFVRGIAPVSEIRVVE
jgi:hypothetical protein